ncbi:receptor homology region, transmembrane domain- and RING domain-containing protein 2 [Vigna radiata var. radiata]|uniref:Receptor homology region, transmembrane domain- and RING domain-containing protein 2 n=1 Tax=Vigna radiata var. radiata TaxID=3916 RepID=A0A1S3V734_VIGRR|nr:receptor homology region, transmembrane domain- and RING domain-containing protein 2 [Vigna radiata var. radiata]
MGTLNLLLFFSLVSLCAMAAAKVVLIGNNITLSFDDIEANFAPTVKGSGEYGVLYLAEPLDACTDLTNKVERLPNVSSPFALVVRGGCSFEEKVRRAQKAGFQAVIVYDNEEDGVLVAMAGNSAGIRIHAVFVSKASGEILKKYAGWPNVEIWLIPTFENSAWSIMAISFISLLAMSAVLATCFFVRRHRIRRERPRASLVREFHGMSSRLVKAMPSLIFTAVLEDNCTSRTCAICLEDYCVGEKIRILPCCHKFHAACVDSWLTSWRTFCPVCKRDARTGLSDPPPSESTPLLSSSPASMASSVLSSVRSSLASSSAIQIARTASQTASVSRNHSIASTPYVHPSTSLRSSYHQSPSLSMSRSSVDLRNASQRSLASHLNSPHSMGYPSLPSLNSRYMSPYIPSPSNASVSYLGSSSHQQHPLRYSESAASFSPFASTHSLPEC